ncbi:MAG TPA: glycosyltransferase family protein, partial [Gemmatales bacterium]|nr:glycosyltransferase family protein [Gemmatales bacterium]
LDARCRGPVFELVQQIFENTQPDVVISDAELWTHHVAQYLKIPRISIDHFGILAYCHTNLRGLDWYKSFFDATMYRWMMGQPDRVILSSFYPVKPKRPGVTLVGTFCRPELRQLHPRNGEQLLVYLNRGDHQFTPRLQAALLASQRPVVVYGTNRQGTQGCITFRESSNLPFLDHLASAFAGGS